MLEGRRLAEEGRSAGLTSSPDFFLNIGGFRLDRSGSSSSVPSSSDPVKGVSGELGCLKPMNTDVSVCDLLWEILCRLDGVVFSTCCAVGLSSASDVGMIKVKVWLTFVASGVIRLGELSRRCSIILMAACSSSKFFNCRLLGTFELSSSSLEFCAESGGDMTAPAGICVSSVTGGGDCRRLPLAVRLFLSSFSLSAVPGGVGSSEGGSAAVLTEGVRR